MERRANTAAVPAVEAVPQLIDQFLAYLSGQQTCDGQAWLWEVFWLRLNVPDMPRPDRMPVTEFQWRNLHRDAWIWRAHAASGDDVRAFSARWEEFVSSRGRYRHWRCEEDPPEGTPLIESALFYATKFNRGQTLGMDWLKKILTII